MFKKDTSPIKQKMLVLLLSGITLNFTHSPLVARKILKNIPKALREINKNTLYRYVDDFYNQRLISYTESHDGSVKIVLTENGVKKALFYNLDNLFIKKPKKWKKRWYITIFDIPEKKRAARDALRTKLKELGFCELQKSVFIYPFECKDEIDFIIEVFDLASYVRYMEVKNITNEAELRLKFGLHRL